MFVTLMSISRTVFPIAIRIKRVLFIFKLTITTVPTIAYKVRHHFSANLFQLLMKVEHTRLAEHKRLADHKRLSYILCERKEKQRALATNGDDDVHIDGPDDRKDTKDAQEGIDDEGDILEVLIPYEDEIEGSNNSDAEDCSIDGDSDNEFNTGQSYFKHFRRKWRST